MATLVPSQHMLDELFEWLRIPSISSGGGDPADLIRAAEWAAAKIQRAGGRVEFVDGKGNPLVVGDLKGPEGAPTVMIYGHYDVQSADPVDAWTTPPFEPAVRDGRIYARGASDDKGNFFPLLYVACEMAADGELPVHVRVLLEGNEESPGGHVDDWVAADERGAECVIVFDSDMLDAETPALTVGMRGLVMLDVKVTTAPADLHSGMYGGSVLNALHALHQMLAAVLPGPDGLLRDELREGITPPTEPELQAWADLPPGDHVLAEVKGRPLVPRSGELYYERNGADASLDVHGIAGGDAVQVRTMVPATAQAKLSLRLAPGQRSEVISPELQRLLREAAPAGAEVSVTELAVGEPALFDPSLPPLRLAAQALERASGRTPALMRVGGSIPVLADFADKGVPVIVSGFALPTDGVHGVDESFRLESLALCERAARELFLALSELGNEA
ncbi:MAG: M20/M25/M40 family metallo-hydrolase [Actinomycetota bacterium]|nr:M20/M25/M40 family metallo-hydrolase [Actinomycetota bacterium]